MKKYIGMIITIIICVAAIVLGLIKGISLSNLQLKTLLIVSIIAGISAAYCFIVGQITNNNSQMDKLWSILPIIYTWIIAGMDNFNFRLVIIAILVTLWGVRLTYNFAKKGAYKLKFWQGEEDYRWAILRKNKMFQSKFIWAMFNLFFIAIYQNFLVLLICLPSLMMMETAQTLNAYDIVFALLALAFLILELIADIQQWNFHKKKKELLSSGANLADIEYPYNKGFNTIGIWNYMRHPNYLGEQGFWIMIYLFSVGCDINHFIFFNPSIVGASLLVLLFLGSSTLGETISSSKYPEYPLYQQKVFKYLPIRRYETYR